MSTIKDMNKIYKYYMHIPEVENPNLDESKEMREQLVLCSCYMYYRVWVNGEMPVSDMELKDIKCPKCGCNTWISINGHSAGVFNVHVHKYL